MSDSKSVFRSLAMVTQLGFCVVTPIFLCIFAGYWIDARYGTKFMLPLLLLGVAAGARSAWNMVKSVQLAEQREAERKAATLCSGRELPEVEKPKQASRIRSAPRKGQGGRGRPGGP